MLFFQASKNIFILNKANFVFDCKVMRILYSSSILTYLMYFVLLWGRYYISNVKPLFFYYKGRRTIHKVDYYRKHTNGLFIKSVILKILDIVELLTLVVMCKASVSPHHLQQLFDLAQRVEATERNFILSTSLHRRP